MMQGRRWKNLTVLFLCSLLALPAGMAHGDQPEIAPPTDTAATDSLQSNLLVIDATTGTIVTWDDQGHELTDVRLLGVTPETRGFTLYDPLDHAVFEDQRSRPDGVVEFWYVPLELGTYRVELETPGLDDVVTTFSTAPLVPSPSDAGLLQGLGEVLDGILELFVGQAEAGSEPVGDQGGRCAGTYGSSVHCPRPCHGWYMYRLAEEVDLWSPIMVVNSPFEGEARADTQWQSSTALFVVLGGWESKITGGPGLDAEDGESQGVFQLALWGIYEAKDVDGSCNPPQGPQRAAKIITTRNSVRTFDLTGEAAYTDVDNLDHVHGAGYDSLVFDTGYIESEGTVDTTGGPLHWTTSTSVLYRTGGSLKAGAKGVGFKVIEFTSETGRETGYRYTFDEGGHWRVDQLGDGEGAWAFCYPIDGRCDWGAKAG